MAKSLQEQLKQRMRQHCLLVKAFREITSRCSVNICTVGTKNSKLQFNHVFISVCPVWTNAPVTLAERGVEVRSEPFTVQNKGSALVVYDCCN